MTPEEQQESCPVCLAMMEAIAHADPEESAEAFACGYCGVVTFPEELKQREVDEVAKVSEDGVIPVGGNIAAECPCCAVPLSKGKLDEFPALYCEQCFGVLITNANFGDLIQSRRKGREKADKDPEPIKPEELQRKIHCPNCGGSMDAHPYYGPGNVVIDSCCRCFLIWFDHGEIAKIERA